MAEPDAESSATYLLSNHVYLCVDEGRAIFLDLRKDVYLALDAVHADDMRTLVKGWPASGHSHVCEIRQSGGSRDRLIQLLLDRGLITTDPTSGKSAAPISIEEPTSELSTDLVNDASPVRIRTVLAFVLALVIALIGVRLLHIERTVTRVRRRREQHRTCAKPTNVEELRQLIQTFTRLRPLAFTSRNACLFESLALLEFLSYHKIYPTWVFAIRGRPFAAHCWLQCGHMVLNDSVEHAKSFVPIMTA